MRNKRKAAIGYAAYVLGSRGAKRGVRRKAHTMMSTVRERSRPRRRRILPLVGGTAAAIAGAGLIAARRHQGAVDEH
jgi:TRAP-type C4-dicarboxylate transport system permease small subunit